MNENAGLLAGAMAWIHTTLADVRAAIAVVIGSTSIGLAELMGWLQSNIGFIGSVCGVLLAIITMWVQLVVGRKALLEYRVMRRDNDM